MQKSISDHTCAVLTHLSQLKEFLINNHASESYFELANSYLEKIVGLRVDKQNANQIINYLVSLIEVLQKLNDPDICRWCLELDSLCFRLSIPLGEFRFSKHEKFRKLRSEQLAYTWRDIEVITPAQQAMLSVLTEIEKMFRSVETHKPTIMFEYQLPTLNADPSDRWIVTFLYDLISHLELAGIHTLVWRQSSKTFYAQVKSNLLQHQYQELDLSAELGCQCILTAPNYVNKRDFQFTQDGYLNTFKSVIKKLVVPEHSVEAYNRVWENLNATTLPSRTQLSQFKPDTCGLIATVESRLAKLELLTMPYNCSLPVAQHTQHLLVTSTHPQGGSEVTALPGADIRIDTIYATVVKK